MASCTGLLIADWADSVIESQCPSVCLFVTIKTNLFLVLWRHLVERCIANSGMQWHNLIFSVSMIFIIFLIFSFVFLEPACLLKLAICGFLELKMCSNCIVQRVLSALMNKQDDILLQSSVSIYCNWHKTWLLETSRQRWKLLTIAGSKRIIGPTEVG